MMIKHIMAEAVQTFHFQTKKMKKKRKSPLMKTIKGYDTVYLARMASVPGSVLMVDCVSTVVEHHSLLLHFHNIRGLIRERLKQEL